MYCRQAPSSYQLSQYFEHTPIPDTNSNRREKATTHMVLFDKHVIYTNKNIFINKNSVYQIEGPDNPTRQLLPIMSTKCCSRDGEGRKDKEGGGGLRSKTKLCATKLYVKDGV